jgi:SRSO17 transposase
MHRSHPPRPSPRPEEWCLIEWPPGAAEPGKFWLSTLPATISRTKLVRHAILRWRIERDDQELKQEIGLGHYEGRGWRRLHHHATLCIAAYEFLAAERARIPPQPDAPRHASRRLPFPPRPIRASHAPPRLARSRRGRLSL